MTIPTGVTVTVTDDVTIAVMGALDIEGTINNGCTQGQAETADLTIENASFETGGHVTISDPRGERAGSSRRRPVPSPP